MSLLLRGAAAIAHVFAPLRQQKLKHCNLHILSPIKHLSLCKHSLKLEASVRSYSKVELHDWHLHNPFEILLLVLTCVRSVRLFMFVDMVKHDVKSFVQMYVANRSAVFRVRKEVCRRATEEGLAK